MSGRYKATKHLGNAKIDRSEAKVYCDHSARIAKEQAKKEARKARRQLDRAETDDGAEDQP